MSTDTQNVVRTTIILDQPSDWEPWLQVITEKALAGKVWEYCDISKPKDDLSKLEEPVRPRVDEVKLGAQSVADLTSAEQGIYQEYLSDFRERRQNFRKKEDALGNLIIEISATIAKRHLYLIKGKTEVYD